MEQLVIERKLMEEGAEAAEKAQREMMERRAAGRHQSFEMQSEMDAVNRRLSFFGRPASKCRLRKRALQVCVCVCFCVCVCECVCVCVCVTLL